MISRGLKTNTNVKGFSCSKGIVNRVLLEAMCFLNIIQIECHSLLNYAEGVARSGTGLVNADHHGDQETS